MHNSRTFREERPEVLHAAIRAHPLATLVTHGASGLCANLVPFTLVEAGGAVMLRAHLAKANPQLADLRAGAEALVIIQGPHAYISPSWYATKHDHGREVPTWNYVMVQVRGRPRVIDDAPWLLAQLRALTDQQEQHLPDPWQVSDAPEAFVNGLVKGITGVEIPIERIDGKWKCSQNQPAVNRAGVIAGLRDAAGDSGEEQMAALIAVQD